MQPSFSDWQDLSTVALGVDDLLSDEVIEATPGYEFVRNLRLTSWNLTSARQSVSIRRTALSTGKDLAHHSKSVYDLLPSFEEFSGTRTEKLKLLRSELKTLSAYKWLAEQPSYVAALHTMRRLGKTKPIYAGDTIEFVFLRAILTPLTVIFLYKNSNTVPSYPSKKELEDVYRDIKRVLKFFATRSPIYGLVAVPLSLQRTLNEFEIALKPVVASYRKPPDDGTLRERDFRDQIIQNLLRAMGGECSSTLVGQMLDLIGYPYDVRDLQRQIKSQREIERSRIALRRESRNGPGENVA